MTAGWAKVRNELAQLHKEFNSLHRLHQRACAKLEEHREELKTLRSEAEVKVSVFSFPAPRQRLHTKGSDSVSGSH